MPLAQAAQHPIRGRVQHLSTLDCTPRSLRYSLALSSYLQPGLRWPSGHSFSPLPSFWTAHSVARIREPQKECSACDVFRLGSGASVLTNLGLLAHRSFPRTNAGQPQDASHVNHSLCASQTVISNSSMLQYHTSTFSTLSSPCRILRTTTTLPQLRKKGLVRLPPHRSFLLN